MWLPDTYMLLVSIGSLGFIAFMACLDSYCASKRADAALVAATRAHIRIDRMQKSASVSHRETLSVSYTDGLDLRDSWADDFHKTQAVTPSPRVVPTSCFKRWCRWWTEGY